ncbi:MAG TPA: hypothetical protein VF993_10690, partial [Myxococcales bacterium]
GQHKITAIYEGFSPGSQTVEIASGKTESTTLTLAPADLAAARARLEKSHQSAPKDADISLNLAQVCDAMKEYPCAVEAYESFLSNAPGSSYQTDLRGRLSEVRAEIMKAERASQGVDFVAEGGEQYTVEVRSADGVARCDQPVQAGRSCRLYVPAGNATVTVGGAASLKRDLVVPRGRSEAHISRGASALPVVAGALFIGAGLGSYFFFDSQRTVADPFTQQKESISPVAYATAGGGVVLGVILLIYGLSSSDSIDLQSTAPPAGAKKTPVKMQIGAVPAAGGMAGVATLRF